MRRFWISFSFALAAIGTSDARADNLEFPEGMWQSQGYTQYWLIERGRFAIYDVTSISCLRRAAGSLEDLRHLTPNEPYPVLKGVEKIGNRLNRPYCCRFCQLFLSGGDTLPT